MDLDSLDDDQLAQLADRIGPHLEPGQYGARVLLTRRQLLGVATGTLGTGALLSLGVDPAAAQAAGQVGTASDPVTVNAYDLDVANSVAMNGNDISDAGTVSQDTTETDAISSNSGGAIDHGGADHENVGSFSTDDLTFNNHGGCGFPTSNQTISSATETTINIDGVDYADDNVTVDTSNNQITVNTAGRYEIYSRTFINDPSDQTQLVFRLYVSGIKEAETKRTTSGSGDDIIDIQRTMELSADDDVSIRVRHDEGSSLDTFVDGFKPEFNTLEVNRVA